MIKGKLRTNPEHAATLLHQTHMIEDGINSVVAEQEHELRKSRVSKTALRRHKRSLEAVYAAVKDLQNML
jgi:hypothetical protein